MSVFQQSSLTLSGSILKLAWPLRLLRSQPQTRHYALLPLASQRTSIISLSDNEDDMPVQTYGVAPDHEYAEIEQQEGSASSPLLGRDRVIAHKPVSEENNLHGGHARVMSSVGNLSNTIIGVSLKPWHNSGPIVTILLDTDFEPI